MSIESVMPSSHLILHHPLLLPPSIFPSIRVFSNESALRIRWPQYCSFSISPSNEYSGLVAFRIDWFDLLAVQGTLKSLLQHHSYESINSTVLSWTIKKAECRRINAFELWCWVSWISWTARRSNQSILKEMNPEYSHPYMTTRKTIALVRQNFVGKVTSLVFNALLGLARVFFQGASIF